MRLIIPAVLLSAVTLSASVAHAEDLAPAEWKAQQAKVNGLLLDVRTPGEVARGKIAGASVVDFNGENFEKKVSMIPRDKAVFVYCASGNRSGRAMELMTTKLGFKRVYNLTGGYKAWVAAGLPTELPSGEVVDKREPTTPEAFDAALKKGKRVLVDFSTPWCTPCQKMMPIVDSLKGITVLKVDAEVSEALSTREKVENVPVFVFYVDGKEKGRLAGEQTKEALEALAKK